MHVAQLARGLDPVLRSRDPDVHQDEIRDRVGGDAERVVRGRSHADHRIAKRLEGAPQVERDDPLVFHHEDTLARGRVGAVRKSGRRWGCEGTKHARLRSKLGRFLRACRSAARALPDRSPRPGQPSTKLNVAPSSSLLSAQIRPPWRVTMRCAIASPIPVPSYAVPG